MTTFDAGLKIQHVFLDFDGVLTDNRVFVDQEGREMVCCTRSDGIGLAKLKERGVGTSVISTETNPVVSQRCLKLGIECHQGIGDKADYIRRLCKKKKIALENCIFLGNDVNDLSALQIVGMPFIVADAHEDLKKFNFTRTKRKGGRGAVRELCDLVTAIHSDIREGYF